MKLREAINADGLITDAMPEVEVSSESIPLRKRLLVAWETCSFARRICLT